MSVATWGSRALDRHDPGLAMDAVQKANAGHPGTAMALAPLGYVLYQATSCASTRRTPTGPAATASCSRLRHACILQYSLLHLTGFDLSLEDLEQFRQWGSRTPGHPERGAHARESR